jgi:phosphoserine phosphatase RsbU/P
LIEHSVTLGLFWFGIFFPERWRFDRRFPWVKWIVLTATAASLCVESSAIYLQHYNVLAFKSFLPVGDWTDLMTGWLDALCVILFLAALIDKLLTSSTPDAKRRVRVLAFGSVFSLGPLTVIFGVLPRFGIDPHHGKWFEIVVPFVAIFPITLAYVVIVQRAMDVRILLRMGTKYLLAKATIVGLEIAAGGAVVFGVLVPMMQGKNIRRSISSSWWSKSPASFASS